ncbi:MAG: hypothetical protein E7578_00410 [Ruminococcaceae bacterium]|nr:hypothetical protein [Oscillospiraceae bacterium]
MITVMIHSVMFDADYEFCLDSNTAVGELADEIGEVICQKEQCRLSGDPEQFMLYSLERKCVIDPGATLRDYGVKTGDTLYFG